MGGPVDFLRCAHAKWRRNGLERGQAKAPRDPPRVRNVTWRLPQSLGMSEAPAVDAAPLKRETLIRPVIAGLAGLIWALAFPNANIAGLAWVAPGLLLMSAAGASGRTCFRLGYLAGVVHYLTGLYWILRIPVPFYPILGWLSLSLFLALYPGTWVWLCWRFFPRRKEWASQNGILIAGTRWVGNTSWTERLGWTLFTAAAWVTWEMVQARLFSGFPWNLLGASQAPMLLVTQLAAYTGVYGISFLLVWTSSSLLMAALRLMYQPESRSGWQREVAIPFLTVLLVCVFGWLRVLTPAAAGPSLKVALVQPSIPQTMIWDERGSETRFTKLLSLSRSALEKKPDLLVWPEGAVPYPIRYDAAQYDAISNLLHGTPTWLALGSDDVDVTQSSDTSRKTNYYNSAFLLNSRSGIEEHYAKRQLVIFGEYVPLARWLPFLRWFTPITGGFTPGTRRVAFSLPGQNARFAPLICFEDMFALVVRDQAQEEIDFLLNLTNDGWFGESAQQWQHSANASLRAIETGVPLVRCCNNGITCWIDAQGRMHRSAFLDGASVYGVGVLHVEIPLPTSNRGRWTFYRKNGDAFGWSCVIAFGAALLVLRRSCGNTSQLNSTA